MADALGRAGGDDVAGASAVNSEQNATIAGTESISMSVPERCTSLPLSRVVSVSRAGSGISSVVTIHGPSGPVAGKFLPEVTEIFW